MVKLADVSVKDAVTMLTATPATIMGISSQKGSLVPGKDADIILFDDDINIKEVLIKGKSVFKSV